MRLLAQRVGPAGEVVGVDVDAALGAQAMDMLHAAGHRQCSFAPVDLESGEPIPGAPFDLVYARLLLFHVSDPVAVLRRLWDAVAPGGHLIVHDYDLRGIDVPPLAGDHRRSGGASCSARSPAPDATSTSATRLPLLLAGAGLGAPDGTDVAGRLEPLRTGGAMLAAVHRSLLPAAESPWA